MTSLRLRYEKGQFTPLDPLPSIKDGDEIEVAWPSAPAPQPITEMLDRTRGAWADWDGFEDLIADGRQKWDEEWQKKNVLRRHQRADQPYSLQSIADPL